MSIPPLRCTRLTEADVDQHIFDLVECGQPKDLKTETFWDRIRVFILSCGDIIERTQLVHWMVKRKQEHMGK